MADVEIVIPGLPPTPTYHNKVTISRDGGPTVTLPITSPRVEASDLAADWAEKDRPGGTPLLGLKARRLDKRRLDVVVDEDVLDRVVFGVELNQSAQDFPAAVAEGVLRQLEQLAQPGPPVTVAYSGLEAGLWRIVDLTYTSVKRAPTGNHVLRAEVAIMLTRASDPPPISRAPAAPPPGPPPAAAAPAPTVASRQYTVRRGDTLWLIAQRTYGNGNLWRRIADANHIRDPRALRVGQVLSLP